MSLITFDQFTDNFQLVSKLGKGNCAQVHKIKHKKTHEVFALKIWKSSKFSDCGQVNSEIEIITKLDDQAIPKIYHYFWKDNDNQYKSKDKLVFEVGVIMELCNKTLEDEVAIIAKDRTKSYNQQRVWAFMREMIRLFSKMQRLGYSHRDVKSGNIMIKQEGPLQKFKVIDFGYSLKNSTYASQFITGTAEYASPKIRPKFDNNSIHIPGGLNVKDDVYSLGKTILELIRAKNCPNEKITPELFSKKIRYFDVNVSFLLSKMLEYDEKNRWDFIQVEEQMIKIENLKASKNIVIDQDEQIQIDNPKFLESHFESSQQNDSPSQSLSSPFKKIKDSKTIQTQTQSFQIPATSIFGQKIIDHTLNIAETKYVENTKRLSDSVVSKVFLNRCGFDTEIHSMKVFEDFILVGMRNHIGVIPLKKRNDSIYTLRPKQFDGKPRQAVFHKIEVVGTKVVFIANFEYFFVCDFNELSKQINWMLQNHQQMEKERLIKLCYRKSHGKVTNYREPKLYEGKIECLDSIKTDEKITCMSVPDQSFLGFKGQALFSHSDGTIRLFNQNMIVYKGDDQIVDMMAFDGNKILFATADGWMKMFVYPSQTYEQSAQPMIYTINLGQQILKFKIVNPKPNQSDSSINWEDQIFAQVYLKSGEKTYLDHELLKLATVTLKKKAVFNKVVELPWKWSLKTSPQNFAQEIVAERKVSQTFSNNFKMETYLIDDNGQVSIQRDRDMVVDLKMENPNVFDASKNIFAMADLQGNVKLLYTEQVFDNFHRPKVQQEKKELSKVAERVSQYFSKIREKISSSGEESQTQEQIPVHRERVPKTYSQFLKLQGKTIDYGVRRGEKSKMVQSNI